MEVSSVTVTTSYTVQARTSMISSYCTVPFSPMFLKYKVVFILGIFCGLLQTITINTFIRIKETLFLHVIHVPYCIMKKTPVIEFNNLLSKASQSYWNVRSMIIEIIWKQNKKEKHCNILQQAFRHLP